MARSRNWTQTKLWPLKQTSPPLQLHDYQRSHVVQNLLYQFFLMAICVTELKSVKSVKSTEMSKRASFTFFCLLCFSDSVCKDMQFQKSDLWKLNPRGLLVFLRCLKWTGKWPDMKYCALSGFKWIFFTYYSFISMLQPWQMDVFFHSKFKKQK